MINAKDVLADAASLKKVGPSFKEFGFSLVKIYVCCTVIQSGLEHLTCAAVRARFSKSLDIVKFKMSFRIVHRQVTVALFGSPYLSVSSLSNTNQNW